MKNKSLNQKKQLLMDERLIRTEGLGPQTKLKLEKKGVKSPEIKNRIFVKGKTYMVPKEDLKTEEDIQAWREKMILKFKL